MKSLNRKLPVICIAVVLLCCQCTEELEQEIVLTNASGIRLTDKAVVIKRERLKEPEAENRYPVLYDHKGRNVPVQLDDLDGDGKWDELFFVADLPAAGQETFSLTWTASPAAHSPRTNVRFGKRTSAAAPVEEKQADTLYPGQLPRKLGYQPFQTDGPSWENDKIGFRHYFDGRNAKDLFGKRVTSMVLEGTGLTGEGAVVDNYHVLKPWGRDILEVGNSAGLGGMALLAGDRIERLGVTADDTVNNVDRTIYRTLAEGPVRSALSFQYQGWHTTGGRRYDVQETSVIWPGMYAFQNTCRISKMKGGEILLIGLVNSNTDKPLTEAAAGDKWVVLMTHDKQTYNKEYRLGLALILPKESYLGFGEAPLHGKFSNSYYGKLRIKDGQPVTYYAVGGWELSNPCFKEPACFSEYVKRLARELGAEVKVEIR